MNKELTRLASVLRQIADDAGYAFLCRGHQVGEPATGTDLKLKARRGHIAYAPPYTLTHYMNHQKVFPTPCVSPILM